MAVPSALQRGRPLLKTGFNRLFMAVVVPRRARQSGRSTVKSVYCPALQL